MNFLCTIVLLTVIHAGLASDFISPADRKRMRELLEKGNKKSNNQTSNETAGEPLDPDDFIRGEQVVVGDFEKNLPDPIPLSGKFEGDIDLRGQPIENFVDKVIDDSPYATQKDVQSNAVRAQWLKWPQAKIPYQISKTFDAYGRGIIASAINEYNSNTCIRWVPKTSADKDYVYFFQGRGCYSSIGKAGGLQYLSLGNGCVRKGITMHEMMHAAGFWHEQSRNDRDDYVTIVWENVQTWARGNFKKLSLSTIDHLGTGYDYNSVMHYGRRFFSVNGKDTIVPKKGSTIGQRKGFSQNDMYKLNKLYGCPDGGGRKVRPRPTPGTCADENYHCKSWADHNHCKINPGYMLRKCKRSCRVCSGSGSCFDKHIWCGYWLGVGQCRNPTYTRYMKIYCPKSCNHC